MNNYLEKREYRKKEIWWIFFQENEIRYFSHTHTHSVEARNQRVLPGPPWGTVFMTTKRWKNTQCFLESKWTLLISFSWPLLKAWASDSRRLLGFHGPLITVLRAYSGREGFGGDTSRRDGSQLPALQMQRKTVTEKANRRSRTVLSHKV